MFRLQQQQCGAHGAASSSAKALPVRVSLRAQQQQQQRGMVTARVAQVDAEGVSIRRRPPNGEERQACGPFDFRVEGGDENKPRNILEEIVCVSVGQHTHTQTDTHSRSPFRYKAKEIERMRKTEPLVSLKGLVDRVKPARDFKGAILKKLQETGKPGLIAEVKKASPSKGVIQPDFDAVRIAKAYEAGGAACLSVLTDEKFFQGAFKNLTMIRAAGVTCPLLCKEFIVEAYQEFIMEAYQVFKARASGADAILLIAAVLPNQDLSYFMKAATSLGMQCLIEVHTVAELERMLLLPDIENSILGINNRDLGTFKVDLANTKLIMESDAGKEVARRGILMVCESGIFTYDDVKYAQDAGCGAILVGESIVKQGDPCAGVKNLLQL
ncbi:hypothetical protein FOA52_011323 [Chlamydomonas sp. UWO 241]|nr:hypothetical protein FOA52_011323 [Chlamydomonas sp. UWO 241]